MAKVEQSFEDLVKSVSIQAEPPISLTGLLSRSSDPEKFTISLADGSSITLPISSVKSHKLIGGSAGHVIVTVDVDRSALPDRQERSIMSAPISYFGTGATDVNTGIFDIGTGAHDVGTGANDLGTGAYDVGTGFDDQGIGYSGHFLDIIQPFPFNIPFGLATARQAPAAAIAALQGPYAPATTFGHYDTGVFDTGAYDHQGPGWTGRFLDIISPGLFGY
jgi:hypothetical protein